ncbi:uncharacterized protein B0I36DRAFT_389129 [Microdochium trichocladiopsis]|uniref:Transcription factor domain-containing protein n=1 Tax=Microdochium trichocladiopsis TaxID=1682393 RepID=A0A9P8XTN4_9PEZI|nr:uncharacterized protein B0I36DRAFT_389129 [Microdochium trichocladiopsis]KAH7014149.1 hypothetical protein B0I36DRAFT_389129 [Microdochium trichocladiopsis]
MEDPFIVTTDLAGIKPKGDSRRLIRRHVMKGKNKRPRKDSGLQGSTRSAACQQQNQSKWLEAPGPNLYAHVTTMDLATMGFPTDMEPYMIKLITQFFVVVEETGSPLVRCTEKGTPYSPYDLIYNDLAHLHITLFMAQTYFDRKAFHHSIDGKPTNFPSGWPKPQEPQNLPPLSGRAILHMNKAIEYLQRKLAVPDLATSLSAIFVVLCLGTCAEGLGDYACAEKHRQGMHHLIEARGGIESLASYPLVQLKCCRFDISLSLKTGHRPTLLHQVSWKAHIQNLNGTLFKDHQPHDNFLSATPTSPRTCLHRLCRTPDARLVNIWTDLSGVCKSFNLALQMGRKVKMVLSSDILVAVMYRLLYLDGVYCPRNLCSDSLETDGNLFKASPPPPLSTSSPSTTSSSSPGSWSLSTTQSSLWSTPASANVLHTGSGHGIEYSPSSRDHGVGGLQRGGGGGGLVTHPEDHELLRLAMLALTSTIFFDTYGLEPAYPSLAGQMSRALLSALQDEKGLAAQPTETRQVHLWVVYVAYTALFSGNAGYNSMVGSNSSSSSDLGMSFAAWLHEKQCALRASLGLNTWAKTRAVLKSFLWVDVVNDCPGKLFYDTKSSAIVGDQGMIGGEGRRGVSELFDVERLWE